MSVIIKENASENNLRRRACRMKGNSSTCAVVGLIIIVLSASIRAGSCYVGSYKLTLRPRSFIRLLPPVLSSATPPPERRHPRKRIAFPFPHPRHAARNGRLYGSTVLITSVSQQLLPFTYMVLLALQFSVQPVITKKFAPKTIIRSTYVLAQDCFRLFITAFLLTATQSWGAACRNWTWQTSLATAGFPALLYLVQSYCSLTAYQNLAPITYNVLNQTKTLSAAICCFLLIGQRQSLAQGVALGILLLAALVMENVVNVPFFGTATTLPSLSSSGDRKDEVSSLVPEKVTARSMHFLSGVLPVLVASLISGLAGAWTQRSLRATSSNSLLFTLQLSVFSILLMGTTLLVPGLSPDRERAIKEGWRVGWTTKTWIPIAVNAAGGVLVGLVTKFSGAVPKGFALIVGMFLSGLLQNMFVADKQVTAHQWIGGFLAAVSVWMHSAYPYKAI